MDKLILDHGDPDGEYRSIRETCAAVDLSFREQLKMVGPDRVSFLQGMVTNDVVALPSLSAVYAAMLTNKGAMVSDVRIFKREGDLLLDVEPGTAAKVKEFLDKHLISEDAEVRLAPELAIIQLLGPKTYDVLGRAASSALSPLKTHSSQALTVAGISVTALGNNLFGVPGADLVVPRDRRTDMLDALARAGATPAGIAAWEVVRVEAGVPRYGVDMVESTIPLEANLERAIHYQKGCYVGQEVIARATFRGHMNRKLTGLELGDQAIPPGTELHRGGKKVGWLTSVVRSPRVGAFIALGYVHRDSLDAGIELDVASGGTAKVHPLPFVPPNLEQP